MKKIQKVTKLGYDEVVKLLGEIEEKYCQPDSGIELREVEGRYRFYTKKDYADYIEKSLKRQFSKLSESQLEIVVILALYGPLTRKEIEKRRGKDSSYTLRTLQDMRVIRKKRKGREILYTFTRLFKESATYEEIIEKVKNDEIEEMKLEERACEKKLKGGKEDV